MTGPFSTRTHSTPSLGDNSVSREEDASWHQSGARSPKRTPDMLSLRRLVGWDDSTSPATTTLFAGSTFTHEWLNSASRRSVETYHAVT